MIILNKLKIREFWNNNNMIIKNINNNFALKKMEKN